MKIEKVTNTDWAKDGRIEGQGTVSRAISALSPGEVIRIECGCSSKRRCGVAQTVYHRAHIVFGLGQVKAKHVSPGILLVRRNSDD